MAGLYFSIGADFSKLQKLKKDIDNLKIKLQGMDQATNPKGFAKLEKQLRQLTVEFDREAIAAQRAGMMTAKAGKDANMAVSDFDRLKKASLMVGGTTGFIALGREIKNVRGEIESIEKSFEVLLGGSKEKVDALIDSMKKITLKSNYSLTDLSGGAQTLLGFNVDEKQIIPVLEQIGNIAMGNTDRFRSLILAFAQMSSTGKLMGQDLLQMINAGFNPLQIIAEKTGKTIIQVKKDMADGAISSEMVAQAFRDAATEGGKFAGMMESQADSIKGSEAKLSGAIQDAFNDIGSSNSELIKGGYEVTTSLVKNYQTVGEVLVGLIGTYGLYKTAIMVDNAIRPIMRAQVYKAEAAELSKLLNREQAYRISQMGLVEGSAEHVAAIKTEIAATAESTKAKLQEEQINLQSLRTKRAEAEQVWMTAKAKTQAAREELTSAIAAAKAEAEASLQKKIALESEKQSRAALRIVKLQEQKDAAIDKARALQEKSASDVKIAAKQKEIAAIHAKIQTAKAEELQAGRNVAAMRAEAKAGLDVSANKAVQTASTRLNTAVEKENAAATAHGGYVKQMVGSKLLIKKLATDADTASTVANTAVTTSNTVATNVLTAAKLKLISVLRNLWAVLAPNPYVLAAAAVIALAIGIYKLATAATAAEQAQSALNKQAEEATRKADEERAAIERLTGIIKDEVSTRNEKQKALDTLQTKYPTIFSNLDMEKIKNLDLADAIRQVNIELEKRNGAQTKANIDRAKDILKGVSNFDGIGFKTQKDITDAKDLLGLDGIWERNTVTNAKLKEMLEEYIVKSENKLLDDAVTVSKANFNALPKNEMIASLEKDIDDIQSQYDRLKKLDEEEKKNPFSNGLSIYESRLESLEKQINTKKSQIKALQKDEAASVTKDKAYWEKIRDDQQKVMDANLPDSNTFKAAKKQRDEAAKMLEQWDKTNLKGQESSAENRLEALRKLDEEDRKRQIEKQKFDFDMQQKAIDLMDDSFDKRIKQIKLNFDREDQAIKEYEKSIAKDQLEYVRNQFVSEKGSDKGFEAYFSKLKNNNFLDKKGASVLPDGLRPEDIANIVAQMNKAAKNEQEKGMKEINKDLSIMLKEQELMFSSDLDKKLADLDNYYNEQRIKAGTNAELISKIESNRKKAKQEATVHDKINKLDFKEQLNLERVVGMESIGMSELVEEKKLEITRKYLQLRINELDKLASAGDEDAFKQMQLLQASLKKLDVQKPVKSLKGLADKALFDTIKKGFEKAGDSAEAAEGKTTRLLGSISQKAWMIAGITSDLQAMFGGLDEGLDEALGAVSNIASGFAQGGIVGGAMAVIGEGMRLFSKASEAEARHQEALKDIADARLASQRAYNLLLHEQNLLLKEAVSIFGEKQITRATNAISEYRDIMLDIQKEIKGEVPEFKLPKNIYNISNSLKEFQKQKEAFDKGVGGLYNAKIVTGHKKTGLFGWGKGKDVYSSILEVYPDVIDAEGKLNKARLQTIVDTQKMSDETKAYLQNLINLEDAAEAAQEELRNYLQSTFGVLGDDIMASLESAIKDKGVSAWEAFGEAGAKVIENLGKQIAYELFFAEKFKKLQSDLEAVYGSGKSEEDIARESMDLVGKFYQNIESDMELAQNFMENWQKEAEKYGFELWNNKSTSQSASKGYSVSMSQDTGDKIEGRITGIQMTGITISNDIKEMNTQVMKISNIILQSIAILGEIKTIQLSALYELKDINKNTKQLYNINDKIGELNKKFD